MTPLDTSAAASDLQLDIVRRMTGMERLRAAIELSELARKLTLARIEHDYPGISRTQLIREFLRCVLPEDAYPRGLK